MKIVNSPIRSGYALARSVVSIWVLSFVIFGNWSQAAFAGPFSLPRGGTAPEYHTLSGDPMVRIQLSGMDRFEVRKTGDRRGAGELRFIKIGLHGVDGYSTMGAKGFGALYARPGLVGGHPPYVSIHKHDIVQIRRWNIRRDGGGRGSIWINARPGARFTVTIDSRELDCAANRKCNRHDQGLYKMTMTLPALPGDLPRTCGPSNTYNLRNIDGMPKFPAFLDINIKTKKKLLLYPVNGQICVTAVSGFSSAATLRPVRRPTQRAGSLPVRVHRPGSD